MKLFILLILSFLTLCASILLFAEKPIAKNIPLNQTIDSLVVLKSKRQLLVYHLQKCQKIYSCGIGSNPLGHKQKQGDNRTPEGIYHINDRNANSNYYKNLGIDYPNTNDKIRCKKTNTATGGDIKIHGYVNLFGNFSDRNIRYSSTWGCIAVTNADMDELYKWVLSNAVINILK